ncbi:MAG: glycosyltransferase [Planctomycetes bacterium]|nr:glycosyltransferase [Planctomycetota bacterium]
MSRVQSISIHLPTLNGEAFLERVLAALAAQRCDVPWDLFVVDSGSTDRTLAILEDFRARFPVPFSIERIHALEFDHGDTRNRLASRSQGELLVFLTQDAIPSSPDWLARLARNFEDPRVAAAYCRNVPRPDAERLTRILSAADPGYASERREVRLPPAEEYARLDPHAKRLLYNFNDVASALRRSVWELCPFARTEFGEDLLLARALLEAGHTLVYDAEATVEHSHDYGPVELGRRAEIDARFNAEWLDRICVASEKDARTLTDRFVASDREALAASGLSGTELEQEVERARRLRTALFDGLWRGGASRVRRPKPRMLERKDLSVLFVVHGFPPETWAGTEVYTLTLAKELARRGQKVAVLARSAPKLSPSEGGPADFALSRETFEGLTVWRLAHRLDHQSLRDTYAHPEVELGFERVLAEQRPDVVHFQHLLHLSAGLIGLAQRHGAASVLTLNDYWGLCARVQLVRPDGVRCEEPQGLGCLVCVKNKDYSSIERAKELYPLAKPLVKLAEFALAVPKLPSVKLERILHKRRVKLGRWARAYRDVQARPDVVLGAMASADLVIGPSRFLREKYLASGRFDSRRFLYSDYGMVTDHLHALEKTHDPQGAVRFGYVGSLVWYKGVDVLVRAIASLPESANAKLAIFGAFDPARDPYHAELADLAARAAPGRVVFRGRFENAKLAEVYREIDVLVVPSVWFENSPLTIHEAFLLSTPVVTSDIGGMKELVRDGVDGLHFKVGDAADLATKLARFVAEPDLVARLSRDFPRIKTIAEDAMDMEWRYRGLVALRPPNVRPQAAAGAATTTPAVLRGNGVHGSAGPSERVSSPAPSAMRPLRSISVLMPTWQGEEFLERVLAALAGQRCKFAWDFLAIDSGSTDRTLAILAAWRERFPVPLRIEAIHKCEFDHGDTRNLLASRCDGDLLVFLTQDAIPSSPEWLETLAANFADEHVGAAYCRNVPRPDAELLTRVFSETDPGYTPGRREVRLPPKDAYARLGPHERRLLYNFNDVASAVRRELWERHPFPRAEFGEDLLMARAVLEAGYTVVYDDRATVEHSHDYTPAQMRARAAIDAKFNVEWLERVCVGSESDARILTERQLVRDREALTATGLSGNALDAELGRAKALREAAFFGLHEGGLSKRRHAPTRMLGRTSLHVLFVVHGFPPDTWAGTEVYTLNLARELVKLGHRCTVLTRAPAKQSVADGGPADFSLEPSEFEGLRVWRMTHRLQHENLRQTYDQPKAVAAFREVLLREKPDVVHFQHLIHLSAGLVKLAREFGLPTVLHCHDYWAICSRVQLIRPDGERCEENQGAGCFACIKDRDLSFIGRMHEWGTRAHGLVDELARLEHRGQPMAEKSRARWEGFGDLMARQEFVLDAYAAADLRISPSRFLRDKLLATGRFEPHTTLYSDNGTRTDLVRALAKRPDPAGRVRFGFVGSLVWYKGGKVLIEALNRLAGRPCVLHVWGDFKPESDPHHAELAALARSRNVEFHGRFDNPRLAEVYADIDVLIVPSLWFENSPITIKEAFLFRTPVVTSDIGGMREFVRDGVDGLHFAVGDAEDLARKLARFLDEPDLAARLSRDFPRVKTIEENAREIEFRYRSLCTRVREAKPRLLFERKAIEATARLGPVEQQGADMLLLRPGGAAIEFDASLVGAGRREFEIELLALGQESRVTLGGRVLIDGREIGRIAPFSAEGHDRSVVVRFEHELSAAPRVLRLESRPAERERELYLRVRRVAVREPAAPTLSQLAAMDASVATPA